MGLLQPIPLSNIQVTEMLEKILNWILAYRKPQAVILFGSAARGEMTEASDIDLALLYNDTQARDDARRHLRNRPPAVIWAVDYLFFTTDEFHHKKMSGGLCAIIAQEGRLLYGTW